MTHKFTRGFTLIELLVVIAIIGILSSVVLASLNTARGKGSNAAVKSNLNNLRAQAELYYDTNGSYGTAGAGTGVCADTNMAAGLNAASNAGAGNTTSDVCNVAAAGAAWAGSAPLRVAEGANGFWCVDSTGQSKGHASALGTATVCP